ncbi:Cyclic nucleotide-gated potassium channel RHE_CH03180 [Gammaproteobacteria bacterium]
MIDPSLDSAESLRLRVVRLLDLTTRSLAARVLHIINVIIISGGVVGIVLVSDPDYRLFAPLLVDILLTVFLLEYLCRLWVAPELVTVEHRRGARWRWIISASGLVDGLAVIAIAIEWLAGLAPIHADMFGVLWVFKLARYSQGLSVLGRVIQLEAEPLISVLFTFTVVLLFAAVLIYLIEGEGQADSFGSVPKALWWTIVTLTTTGYGDAIPITIVGRILAGIVMMCGIILFALWAAILATGFSQEMRRRAFLKTWDLVAQVPLFDRVGAAVISEVAQRLRPREVATGTVILRKGEIGDCMYFIVSGEIMIDIGDQVVLLHDGAFFGELALITGARRNATASATHPTQLLLFDIADFRDLAARHPDLTAAIHEEAERRLKG